MKLQLWVINSLLLFVLVFALILNNLFKHEPPVIHIKKISKELETQKIEAIPTTSTSWEKIYQNDVFNTYQAPAIKVIKQSFVTPIPEAQPVSFTPPPEPKPIPFLPPLTISLKGIIASASEENSVAMIADETNKEKMFHLGDKVKDAEVIKISRNKVVLLRSNGQQETFYLIKEDLSAQDSERWNNIVKKINDQKYKIDPYTFQEEVDSFGNFIERAAILGIAYSQGTPIGIKIGDTQNCDVATNLGLIQGDVIRSINGIDTADSKNRTKIYDTITAMKINSTITVDLIRSGQNISIIYELTKLERIFKKQLPTGVQETKGPDEFPMNALQERDKRLREFSQVHAPKDRHGQASDLRKHLLENLHSRLRNARNNARRW